MKALLHICCGPCACGALPHWKGTAEEVVGFFYNPNIHPFMEYRRRLEGAREVVSVDGTALIVDDSYQPEEWFATVSGEQGSRCERCIGFRLDRAANEAAAQGCDLFSTTLSISPWQDHEAIRVRGEAAGVSSGVEFVYEDLRSRYRDSQRVSRELGVYRQKYCGCLISEWERYRERRR